MSEDINLEKYLDLVHRLARPYAKASNCNEVRDSDAYAEGLLCLVKAKRGFDPERRVKFITYAYHTIKNGLLTWWKKNKLSPIIEEWSTPSTKTESPVYGSDEIEYLKALVDLFPLDSQERIIFEGRLAGKTFDEIANVLGCSKQNVVQTFNRKLKPILFEKLEKRNETRSRSDLDKQNW